MKMRSVAMALAATLLAGSAMAQQTNLRIGLADDPDALDPHLNRSAVGVSVMISLCDRLIGQDAGFNFIPQLATGWTWSADNLSLTMTLREGVTFHDGTPFNAEAVKFNIDRAMTLAESQRKDDASSIASIEVTGPYSVVVKLKAPFSPLLSKFADRLGMIMSPKAARDNGMNFARNPICAGPYKFVERVAQDRIVFDKYAAYWDAAAYPIDRITYRIIPDGTVRLANLQSGGLDIAERLEPTDADQIQANPRLKLLTVNTIGYQSLVINVANTARGNHPMGRDARVREAFDLALDRKVMADVAFGGRYLAGNQFAAPGTSYYNNDLPIPPRNLDRAKQILKEAGYTTPVPFEITVPNRPSAVRVAEIIQAMTNEAGFDTKLKVVEFATSLNLTDAGDFQAWGPIGPQYSNDPDGVTYMSLHTTGSRNVGKYSSAEMDKIMDATRMESDPVKRRALFLDAVKVIVKDRTVIYLFHQSFIFAHSTKVTGFQPIGDGFLLVRGTKLAP